MRRLEAAQQELTGDFEMTQMPDDLLGGQGSGQESVDSDDSGEAGASGFGNEDAMEESLIDEAGEGGEAAAPAQRTQSEQQGSAIDEGVGEGGGTQGGGFSPSLAADDIEQLSDLEEDEEEEDADEAAPGSLQPAAGPGDATQLEAMELDDGGAKRIRRLRELRDEVVALLRDVPSAGPLPMELRKRALALRRLVAPFMGASEAARRMSGALSELLTREVADGGGGPSGVAPGPDAAGAPQGARIVGRATDVLVDGSRRHSFLLFQPPRSYSWLTEAGMRADPALLAILDAHPGPKGDDPSGDGFVVAVVRARGPTGRRQYRVRWTVEPQVPVKYAEAHDDGWLLRRQLVNPALVDAFDRRQRDEDASGDEDGDDGGGGGGDSGAGGAEAESQDAGAGGPSALKWSPAQGRPLLSMRRAVAQHGGAHLGALWEYTASRLFALRCRAPPAPGRPGAPTEDELVQVGKDLYEVDRKALDAVFRREREQEARERLLAADEDDADDEEGDEEEALAAWRAEREAELCAPTPRLDGTPSALRTRHTWPSWRRSWRRSRRSRQRAEMRRPCLRPPQRCSATRPPRSWPSGLQTATRLPRRSANLASAFHKDQRRSQPALALGSGGRLAKAATERALRHTAGGALGVRLRPFLAAAAGADRHAARPRGGDPLAAHGSRACHRARRPRPEPDQPRAVHTLSKLGKVRQRPWLVQRAWGGARSCWTGRLLAGRRFGRQEGDARQSRGDGVCVVLGCACPAQSGPCRALVHLVRSAL